MSTMFPLVRWAPRCVESCMLVQRCVFSTLERSCKAFGCLVPSRAKLYVIDAGDGGNR